MTNVGGVLHGPKGFWGAKRIPVSKRCVFLCSIALLSLIWLVSLRTETEKRRNPYITTIIVPEPKLDYSISHYGNSDVDSLIKSLSYSRAWIEDHGLMDIPLVEVEKRAKKKKVPIPRDVFAKLTFIAAHRRAGAEEKNLKRFHAIAYNATSARVMMQQLEVLKTKHLPKQQRPLHCNNCFVFNFKTVIKPRVCDPSRKEEIRLIALVTTVAKNKIQREVIRQTWGRFRGFSLVFLLGDTSRQRDVQALLQENLLHGDILLEDYVENYYNLSYKVLSGFNWVKRSCPDAQFIIRAADDTYVHIPFISGLIKMYGKENYFQDYQIGECYIGDRFSPYRIPDNKGFISTYEYNASTYPPYALGTVFMLSRKLLESIVKEAVNVPFFAIEDTYFGFVLKKVHSGCFSLSSWSYNMFAELPMPGKRTHLHASYHTPGHTIISKIHSLVKSKTAQGKLNGTLYVNEN